MLYLVLGGIGWLIGAAGYREFGWLFGLAMGLMVAEIYNLRNRIARLEGGRAPSTPLFEKTKVGAVAKCDATVRPDFPPRAVSPPVRETMITGRDDRELALGQPVASKTFPPPVTETVTVPRASVEKGQDTCTDIPDLVAGFLKKFFTTGNVVTKIGVIVLFFGFAFLLKYAAQRNLVPIEFRLVGVFLCGICLVGAGWRLRASRMMYALLLQGGGVGVLYLTIYAAAKLYHLLPYGLSFGVMFCLVIFSGILAVLQDAKHLAIFGIVGGFLAPVLMSTGSGSHVALFSYYALLNFSIVGIAWYKAWRELNLVGFAFIFVIASL